jgi:lipopolysaccharide transport system ATP-binding protein
MSSKPVLELNNVSKCYRLYSKPQDRLLQMLFRGRGDFYKEFWALKNVSLRVNKGACVGIVGRNGAGKSTLLQIISKIITPTTGTVSSEGRIAALLELGTGFNPDFTGKENVFLNGSILGLFQEEIRSRYESIISFADIGQFIEQPVKTYSSGMMVRLAFAVAIHVDPEVLIVDEALSVGDAKFQAKCFRKFQEFRDEGKTILFVTHATEQVIRHCDEAYLLENGEVIDHGVPKSVTHRYLSLLFDNNPISKEASDEKSDNVIPLNSANNKEINQLDKFTQNSSKEDKLHLCPGYNKAEYRWGNKDAEIIDCLLSSDNHWLINHFKSCDNISIYFKVYFKKDVQRPIYGLTIKTPDGVTVYGTNSRDLNKDSAFTSQKNGDVVTVRFSLNAKLASGHYLVCLGVAEELLDDVAPLDRRYDAIEIYISNDRKVYGIADLEMSFALVA